MLLLSLGFTSDKCDVYEKINRLSSGFKDKGINIKFVENDDGRMHFIKCFVKDEDSLSCDLKDVKRRFDVHAANLIYEIIIDNYQMDIINRIIKNNYYYLKATEIGEISKKCADVLTGANLNTNENYMAFISMKNTIINKVHEYLSENTDIMIDGFLRFRLKDINMEVNEIVDRVVEEYLIEKEYNEFIKLLKYFVEIQESRIEIVNIVINIDGSYSMYDDNLNRISGEALKELIGDGLDGEQNLDDLLVSSLITMAPMFIIIHNAANIRNKEIIETIKSVFSDRVKICSGCDLCLKRNPAHKF
ncbi:YtxC-like family protein [Oxobacter pfennigii]|uniref:YtxC-like family protein n=1 Tax=Oxobacter pfennigii TaxID=36849 RepID=A0A0N8NSI5_9CLOT|nr:putative sporulation protein YtxC [Oxobacter pfennigii]KPU42128.1 YtxC-like family protein [Oxobacter pfennigii]